MPKNLSVTIVIVLLCGVFARAAIAQTTWSDRARISINGGVQPSSTSFTSTSHPPVYQQFATVTAAYDVPSGAFFDGDVILHAFGALGIEIGLSAFSKSQTVPITGSIPHPVLVNVTRPLSGRSGSLDHSEIVGRIDAAYLLSTRWADIAVSAGPSFFTVNQDLVANVSFAESPSFDAVTLTGTSVSGASATKLGVNAGIDIGIKLSKNVGVGGMVRYSRASLVFPLANSATAVSADAGGTHVGGGVRLYF